MMRFWKTVNWTSAALIGLALVVATPATADIVHLDDVIIDGSACIGLDCVNGESFGFDTLRLKENNLRIKAQDTSSTASFPSRDWQITFNDSSNGGANKFSIDDIDGGRTPFTIEAGAPSHSLYVDDGGRLGLGTSTPVVDVHVKSGNTPTLRLEQDGSSGFTPQIWDVAGNEANFFIRDVSNGSTLPIRVRPGAPSSAIDIAANGNVGIGTSNVDEQLHLENSGNAFMKLEGGGNNARVRLVANASRDWVFGLTNTLNQFLIQDIGAGAGFMFLDGATGDMTISGTNYNSSDRNAKTTVVRQDGRETLAALVGMPISTWSYKHNPAHRHVGPMAQDFYAAFGLGKDNLSLSPLDTSGIAMSAIQGLHEIVQEKEVALEVLRVKNAELAARLAALEEIVQADL